MKPPLALAMLLTSALVSAPSAGLAQSGPEPTCEQRLTNLDQAATYARQLVLSDYAALKAQTDALVRALTQAREEVEKLRAEKKKDEPKAK